MNRQEKLQRLAEQYSAEFAGNNYPDEFKPHGTMTECNFGGKLIILSNDGEACIVWSDWADEAVSDKLEEFEIVYKQDDENSEDNGTDVSPGFYIDADFVSLDSFMRI